MATKNKLSVYLVKEGITSANDIFEDPGKIRVLERYSENSAAYFVPSLAHEPNWLRNFFLRGGDGMLLQANSRVVLIKSIQIDEEYRTFALTFGYARFLFREDVLEEQFGLKIVLNSIKQNQIRRISKASVGSNQKQSDEQLPTHGIFYTAITRAKTNLKIYWSSETMHDVVKGFATDESKRKSLEIVKTKLGKN